MSTPALIIVGASARAAAESARRAGYEPWCVDLFADRDLQAVARVLRCPGSQYPQALPRLVAELGAPRDAPVLFTGAMENHLDMVRQIAEEHPLFGSDADTLALTRHPLTLARLPDVAGVHFPAAYDRAPMGLRIASRVPWLSRRRWLVKPYRSAGGAHIRAWNGRTSPADSSYLQQFIAGTPMSAAYRSDGWSCRLLGVTEQLIGDRAWGADGFRYVGSVGPVAMADAAREATRQLGVLLTQRFDLRGIFGVDFILDRRGDIWPVEINPRYTASIEVIERSGGPLALAELAGRNVTARSGAREGRPRPTVSTHTDPATPWLAKGIAFARTDAVAPDLYAWLSPSNVSDVPVVGEAIHKRQPICTLWAVGATRAAAVEQLHEAAAELYARMDQ